MNNDYTKSRESIILIYGILLLRSYLNGFEEGPKTHGPALSGEKAFIE